MANLKEKILQALKSTKQVETTLNTIAKSQENLLKNYSNPVFNQKESSKTVSVVVDINDRQISNKDENYCSSRESFHEILTINEKIISFGLRNIIEGDKVLCLN